MSQKLFRDPIYDYILISRKYKWLLDLVDCPEVQRLRFINQLGLCSYTYPGSTHTRFSHSLGVLNLMTLCILHLKQDYSKHFKGLDEKALLAAALLHDIGHSPLSHATEEIFVNHEDRTIQIIQSPKTEVNRILCKVSKYFPDRVSALIAKKSQVKKCHKSPCGKNR